MPSNSTEEGEAEQSTVSFLRAWGDFRYKTESPLTAKLPESPVPPTVLATLITSLHARPVQRLPLLFPPILLGSTFMNIYSYTTDSAGITAAWSGLYLLLARQRKPEHMMQRFGARGFVRGAAMVVSAVNVVAGGWVYAKGKKEEGDSVG
ncbi:MAG: hypothetical protein Q9181_001479 [Wetmoreana brouardii]